MLFWVLLRLSSLRNMGFLKIRFSDVAKLPSDDHHRRRPVCGNACLKKFAMMQAEVFRESLLLDEWPT
jgi:hypothetical protein